MMKNKNFIFAIILIVFVLIICTIAGIEFRQMYNEDIIYPNSSLTKKVKLSNYFSGIKNSNGDSDIYIFDSGKPGANILILGGTHPNEPAGFMTAVTLIENTKCEEGKLFIIPQACLSGYTCTDPLEGYPQYYTIKTKSGDRKFRFGSRVLNPLDQWPDPQVYNHYPSGQKLSGFETRNMNRAYPGRADGSFTEKIGYAILELIKKEKIDLAFDLHEAAPEIPIIDAIVAHEKGKDIAAGAILNLEIEGLKYAFEISPKNFRGLSHREWGDSSNAYTFLMETSNPIQGRLRGKTDIDLILNGKDDLYKQAQESGRLRIVYEPEGVSLSMRVGRHLQGLRAIFDSYNENSIDKKISVSNMPTYNDLIQNGIANYLK